MKKKHLYVGLIIAILACYFTFRNVSLKDLSEALVSMHYIYLIPSLLCLIVFYYLRAVRWKYLLLSIKEVDQNRLLSPIFVGFMANMLPARVGELIRAYLLGKRESIPFSSSFATIVIERIFDMIIILSMLGSLLFFQPDLMENKNLSGDIDIMGGIIMFGWISMLGIIFLIVMSLLLIYKQKLVISWIKFVCKPFPEKITAKILDATNSFSEGLHVLKNLKTTIIVFLLSVCIWAFSLLSYYPFYFAFDIDYLPFSSVIILFIIVCIFITIFPTPGFVGSFQAGCMVGLHNLYGVPEATAASYGIVVWAFSMLFTVIGGIYFIITDNISIKEMTKAYS